MAVWPDRRGCGKYDRTLAKIFSKELQFRRHFSLDRRPLFSTLAFEFPQTQEVIYQQASAAQTWIQVVTGFT